MQNYRPVESGSILTVAMVAGGRKVEEREEVVARAAVARVREVVVREKEVVVREKEAVARDKEAVARAAVARVRAAVARAASRNSWP